MPWFNVDDGFANSKPVLRIQRRYRCAAIGLWTLAGSWSAKELTDGFIPDHAIEEFASSAAMAEQLVRAGLWRKVDGGWQFEGWAKWQKTREQVLEFRATEAERKRIARAKTKPRNAAAPDVDDAYSDPDRIVIDSSTSRAGEPGSRQSGATQPKSAGRQGASGVDSGRTDPAVPLGLRAESGQPIPEPLPTPIPSLVETSVGGVTSVDASENPTPPKCTRHKENSPTPCRTCKARRLWEDEQAAAAKADELNVKRRRKQEIADCGLCDDNGLIEVSRNQMGKCAHPREASNA